MVGNSHSVSFANVSSYPVDQTAEHICTQLSSVSSHNSAKVPYDIQRYLNNQVLQGRRLSLELLSDSCHVFHVQRQSLEI